MSHLPDHRPDISVVVPVYNSARCLPIFLDRLEKVFDGGPYGRFEVLLVNDGSEDDSWRVIADAAEQHSWVRGIDLMRNFGQHNALLCGIRAAAGKLIVTMDDDLQHPLEELPKLLHALQDDIDVVYGAPLHPQHGLLRNLASQITKLALQKTMGAQTARHVSAWRVFRRDLRDAFSQYRGAFVSIDVLLTWATTRFAIVFVRHDVRTIGKSNYSYRKLMTHGMNLVTGFTVIPLQFASWMGFALALFGVVVLMFVLGRYLIEGGSVPGFPFLASIIAIFSGAQLFALGIIGEYLARMHFRLMDRPSFAVRATTIADWGESPAAVSKPWQADA